MDKNMIPRLLLSMLLAGSAGATSSPVQAAVAYTGTFYEDSVKTHCTGPAFVCRVLFSPVPAGKTLTILKVACHVQRGSPVSWISLNVSLTSDGAIKRFLAMPVVATPTDSNAFYYNFNQDVLYLVTAGRFPQIRINSPTASYAYSDCTITGNLN